MTQPFSPLLRFSGGALILVALCASGCEDDPPPSDAGTDSAADGSVADAGTDSAVDAGVAATLLGTQPEPGATGVEPDIVVEYRLSRALDPATADAAFSMVETAGGAAVAGTLEVVGSTVRFTPSAPLAPEQEYETRLTRELRDTGGQQIQAEYFFVFTVAAPAAPAAPELVSSEPEDGATGVERTSDIRLTFDRELDPSTVTDTNVTLTRVSDSMDLFAAVSLEGGVTVVVEPSSFDIGESYRATVSTDVTGLAGTPLASDVVIEFATGDELSVVSVSPSDGATEVGIGEPLVITFDADIDPSSVTAETVVADARADIGFGAETVMPGTATVSGNTVTFTPEGGLWQEYETTFRVTLRTGEIRGTDGQVLAGGTVGSFTTVFHDPLYYYFVHTAGGGRASYLEAATLDVTMGANSTRAQWYFTELEPGTLSMRTSAGGFGYLLQAVASDNPVRMSTFFSRPGRTVPPTNQQWTIASGGARPALDPFVATPGDSPGLFLLRCENTGDQVLTSAAGVSMTSLTRRTDQLWWFERGPAR